MPRVAGLLDKVGTLTPGKEADIIFLETKSIDIAPMNNVAGSIVTMMDTSHVERVMIAGKFKLWDYELVGWNVDKLVRDIEASRDRMLGQDPQGSHACSGLPQQPEQSVSAGVLGFLLLQGKTTSRRTTC